ncbi:hypothetical protein ACCUM_2957 [Candidatus Accumulibacter phosphatis]|uniref:Uncharacterized protein n=1 Tax=Candidatus Accumulibacter phosphatis TaxID=327160 RepID=A0A5S4EQ46_9PROT|nr:hypothetical protein ACCUM_2957 [Candidatus Accumulibacter phosphatis]
MCCTHDWLIPESVDQKSREGRETSRETRTERTPKTPASVEVSPACSDSSSTVCWVLAKTLRGA